MTVSSEKRVILIAPDDVENELETIRAVVEQALTFLPRERLTLWYWRTDGTPGMHLAGPQGLTDQQMEISKADLVIAVFWSRLGTPVQTDESGTAHELRLAWESWRKTGKPDVWIYACSRPVPQSMLEEEDQFPRLRRFLNSLPAEQATRRFESAEELQREFAKHLGSWLNSNDAQLAREPVILRGVLSPPDSTRTVPRPKEVQRLAESLREAPITCLHGISGSGKSRLAAQYGVSPERLAEHSHGLLWHQVPEGGTLEEMLALLPQELVGPEDLSPLTRSRNLLTALRLSSQLLVLDDFHQADRASFAPLLRVAGSQSAPAVLLLLSRVAVYPQDATEIAIRAWSGSETRRLLEQLGLPEIPDGLLRNLTKKTGGLPLAIRFFWVLVKEYGRAPTELLEGELSRTHLTESWYAEIKEGLSDAEINLLRYFSLAEPYVTEPVLKRAQARLDESLRMRAFMRLQTLLLVESRGGRRWAVHPFVAEHTLNDTDSLTRQSVLRDLCQFSLDGIRNLRPRQMTHQSLAAGIRAARYAQRAKDVQESEHIIAKISNAAKRLGYYRSLRDLCQWHMTQKNCDPWVRYHYAHCELILGNPKATVSVLSSIKWPANNPSLGFATARILSEAQAQLGDLKGAISGLQRALAHSPGPGRGAMQSSRQAKATLARLLLTNRSFDEARQIASELARTAQDPRSLAVTVMLLGQLDAIKSPANAEKRFRVALSKFRSVGDRRGQAWATQNLAEALLRQRKSADEAKRLVRESLSNCARIGESTLEYQEWLERMRTAYSDDPPMLTIIDQETLRVSSDLGSPVHS
jgi:tetratricopeptide (TPR) repeat protein